MAKNQISVSLKALHAGQRELIRKRSRFNVCNMGRRFGKTTVGINILTEKALAGYPVAWFAPTYKLLTDVWKEAKRCLEPVISTKSEHDKQINLITGGKWDFWTLDNDDPGRGRKYAEIIIDEAAMVRGLKDKWNLAIKATLMDYQGGAWFMSTPKGDNDFKEFYDRAAGGKKGWASFCLPTMSNPYIPQSEIDDYEADVPRLVFEQEILAQFITFGGNLIKREMMLYADCPKGLQYSIGVDLAISTKDTADYTAIVVMARSTDGIIYVVDAQRMRGEFNQVLNFIQRMDAKWKSSIIKIEDTQYQAAVIQELARTTSLPVNRANPKSKDKVTRFRPLQVRYEQNLVRHAPSIVDSGVFEAEMLSFDNGKNDDFVDAAVYAHLGLDEINNKPVSAGRRIFGSKDYGIPLR